MTYISVESYLGKTPLSSLSPECIANMNTLIPAINELMDRYGEQFIMTSGFRNPEHNKKVGGSPNSNHCKAAAIDIADGDGKLNKWLKLHPEILQELSLYCEERQGGWQHIQCISPRSGKRWFFP